VENSIELHVQNSQVVVSLHFVENQNAEKYWTRSTQQQHKQPPPVPVPKWRRVSATFWMSAIGKAKNAAQSVRSKENKSVKEQPCAIGTTENARPSATQPCALPLRALPTRPLLTKLKKSNALNWQMVGARKARAQTPRHVAKRPYRLT
jgi:hypothetical protein